MKSSWELLDLARRDVVRLLSTLSEDQWNAQSLCSEWRVRDVVAHLTSTARVGMGAMLWGIVTHGFKINRFMGREARAHGDQPTARHLAELEALIGSRRLPPGLTPEILIYDYAVHTQDIAVPLGIPHPVRRELLDFVAPQVRKTGAGLTSRATDLDWSHGSGPEVRGPAVSLLLALAKRPAGLERLEGPGRGLLAARLS